MRLLIAGWQGQVARALVEAAPGCPDVTACAVGRAALDICEARSIDRALSRIEPSIVINSAAYTAVDKAETDSKRAFALNHDGARLLAEAAARRGIPIIHLSSDYVYDGRKASPYVETDPARPATVFGRSKLEGEQAVQQANPKHVVLRTAWVFSPSGRNFVKTMLGQAAEQERVRVVDDQHGSPTYAPHLVTAILELARRLSAGTGEQGAWGIYHAAGTGTTTWRDTHLRIEGPVVGELQKLFMGTWEKQRANPLALKDYFPELSPHGNDMVRAIGSTPDDAYSLMYLTLISAIGNAVREVYLTNAYFVPDPQLLKALVVAAGRGVDVRLILPGHTDSEIVFHAGRSHYSGLLEGGVKLYERGGALLHSKTAVIDGVWSTVGSTNLDWRSFLDNDEINAVVIGREFGDRMRAAFAADMAASEAIDLARWEQRSLLLRIKEWTARLWGRLL